MFADEKVSEVISGLYPPFTQFLVPVVLLPLALFVAIVQTFVFTLLSMIYLGEVSHAPHEHKHGGEHSAETGEALVTAHV
jgi:F0F1-type ATP synthase membrane subunit a